MAKAKSKRGRPRTPVQNKASNGSSDPDPASDWRNIKHFKPVEFTCKCEQLCDHAVVISMSLVKKLDKVRDLIGMPIKINSGTRCEKHNQRVGGKIRSAHTPKQGVSHAVDVHCPNSAFRYAFLAAAMPMFSRIGIGKDFIHVDDDPDLPPNVIWVY